MSADFMLTRYGFAWGGAQVTRIASVERRGGRFVALGISKRGTPEPGNCEVEIYVSPKGNRIRVFRKGRELK